MGLLGVGSGAPHGWPHVPECCARCREASLSGTCALSGCAHRALPPPATPHAPYLPERCMQHPTALDSGTSPHARAGGSAPHARTERRPRQGASLLGRPSCHPSPPPPSPLQCRTTCCGMRPARWCCTRTGPRAEHAQHAEASCGALDRQPTATASAATPASAVAGCGVERLKRRLGAAARHPSACAAWWPSPALPNVRGVLGPQRPCGRTHSIPDGCTIIRHHLFSLACASDVGC